MKKYKIIIIDDEESILNSLKRTLHKESYDVITFLNSEDAENEIKKGGVNLIMCDYKLDGRDGIEFLEKISKESPQIATILFTGNVDFQMAVDAVNKSKVDKLIAKPWENQDLKNTIKQAIESKKNNSPADICAKDIMSMFAITIHSDAKLVDAAHLMMRFKISGLPVVSKSGELLGIITATDLFRIMGETVKNELEMPESRNIENVMTKNVFSVNKESTLVGIINLMMDKNIHTLPVIEDKEIVGIIGRRDVLNTYYKLFSDKSVKTQHSNDRR